MAVKALMRVELHGGTVATMQLDDKGGGRAYIYTLDNTEVSREAFAIAVKLSEAASLAALSNRQPPTPT